MSRFLFMLDESVTETQKALVLEGLSARFPTIRFEHHPDAPAALENSIIPLVGRPHPTDPECSVVEMPDASVTESVQEVFEELLEATRSARPS